MLGQLDRDSPVQGHHAGRILKKGAKGHRKNIGELFLPVEAGGHNDDVELRPGAVVELNAAVPKPPLGGSFYDDFAVVGMPEKVFRHDSHLAGGVVLNKWMIRL